MTWREPTEIRLPDGRIFQISDLVGRRTRGQNYNLRTEKRVKLARQTIDNKKIPKSLYQSWSRKPAKYQLEERIWQAQATVEELQAKYSLTITQAQHMRYQARYILDKLDIKGDQDG